MNKAKMTAVMIFSAALLTLIFSGCSFRLSGINELLKPPKPYGTNDELQAAFEESVGGDVVFKAPVSGEFRSSFIVKDIDGDGSDEAIAFYSESSADTSVMISLFNYKGGEWSYSLTVTGRGCDVYSVDFCDMNSDGKNEIIISWSLFDSKSNKMLSVYDFSDGGKDLTEIAAEMFTLKELADIDSDGDTEILLLHLDSASENQTSVVKMLKMTDGGSIKLADKKYLDGNISGYVSIKTDVAVDGRPLYIYVDATKGESQMITEVIYWDDGAKELAVPMLDRDTLSNNASWRSVRLESRDIDGDGIIEIPAQTALAGDGAPRGKPDTTSLFYMTSWLRIEDGEPVAVRQSFVNYSESVVFFIPFRLEGKISVTELADLDKWDVYGPSKRGGGDEHLFSLIFTDKEVREQDGEVLFEGYDILAEHGEKKVLVSDIPDGAPLDKKELAECVEYYV
ncbi:MAG: hypothetical protein GX107_04295 [Clostridiales bacterium]|jgi:hypothetical protein|nr:hypothetical protein [Clostridiales bacterium]